MPDIYINTDRPVDRSIVAGINQPQREAPIGAFVAGSSYDINLYFVKNDGSYNALSGVGGTDIHVAISTISRPESGTFTLTDGTDTTSAISYGASAQVVEDALNALNSDTGLNLGTVSLVDVVKVNDTQYTITFRTFGAMTALSGSTVSLFPESTPTGSIAVTGSSTVYAQQTIELTRQPAIFQETWSTITNGFSGTVALNTTRLLQSLALEPSQPFYLEVKLDAETVAREIVGVEHSTMPASAFSGAAIALKSTEGVDILSTGETGGTKYLREDGDGTSSWQTVAGAAGDMEASTYDPTNVAGDAFDMDNMVEGTAKILTSAERTTIGTVAPHIADTANPHSVTKAQVGLGNVDDTADAAKPVSTAQQAAINLKQDIAAPNSVLLQLDISSLLSKAIPATTLDIPVYAAADTAGAEAVHPYVMRFNEPWNGWLYWMAMTPYGDGLNQYEDPSIVVSNDGESWEVPAGLTNPIAPTPAGAGYNSDTNLYFEDGTLYCLWRDFLSPDEKLKIKSSTDGVTWSAETTLTTNDYLVLRPVSPSLHKIDGVYIMWAVDSITKDILKATSSSLLSGWSSFAAVTKTNFPLDPWHMEVREIGDDLIMMFVTDTADGGFLYMAKSDRTGNEWTSESFPVIPMNSSAATSYYKSSFIPIIINGGVTIQAWVGVAGNGGWGVTYQEFEAYGYNADAYAREQLHPAAANIPPALVGDVFDRVDDATGVGTSSNGVAWSTTAGNPGIINNEIYSTDNNTIKCITPCAADGRFGAWFNNTGHPECWIMFRVSNPSNYWRLGAPTLNSNFLRLQKVIGGSVTEISVFRGYIEPNDWIEIAMSGDDLEFSKNGVLFESMTDSYNNTATDHGFQLRNNSSRVKGVYFYA